MLRRINVVEKVKKQLIDMLRRIKVEPLQLIFDMLRRINVVESEETTWYIEKDKSWNLAAAIWYVKKDKCGWKWSNNLMICWEW